MILSGKQVYFIINDEEREAAFELENPEDHKIAFSLLNCSIEILKEE